MTRNQRWLVSGVLGLAVLGTTGCAGGPSGPQAAVRPAIVVEAPAEVAPPSTAAKNGASTTVTAEKSKQQADSSKSKQSKQKSKSQSDGAKRVPPASPTSVPSPASAKSPSSADTP